MHLMSILMYKSLYSGNVEEMKAQNLMDCIECGCCAYTCPACVPLVLSFKAAKHHIRTAQAAQQAAAKKP
jgi:electron transport complex protein RnfC